MSRRGSGGGPCICLCAARVSSLSGSPLSRSTRFLFFSIPPQLLCKSSFLCLILTPSTTITSTLNSLPPHHCLSPSSFCHPHPLLYSFKPLTALQISLPRKKKNGAVKLREDITLNFTNASFHAQRGFLKAPQSWFNNLPVIHQHQWLGSPPHSFRLIQITGTACQK